MSVKKNQSVGVFFCVMAGVAIIVTAWQYTHEEQKQENIKAAEDKITSAIAQSDFRNQYVNTNFTRTYNWETG